MATMAELRWYMIPGIDRMLSGLCWRAYPRKHVRLSNVPLSRGFHRAACRSGGTDEVGTIDGKVCGPADTPSGLSALC